MTNDAKMGKSNPSLKILNKVLVEPKDFEKKYPNYKELACFSKDCKKYGALEDWEEFLELTKDLPKEERVFNELIKKETLVKPYLDIEWMKEEFPALEEIEGNVIEAVKKIILKYFEGGETRKDRKPRKIKEEDILVSACCREKATGYKYSYHIVVSTDKPVLVFKENIYAYNLAEYVRENIDKELSSLCADKSIKEIIDIGVYKKTQNFRLINNSKSSEVDFPLIKCEEYLDVPDSKFIITNIKGDYDILESEEHEDTSYQNYRFSANNKLSDEDLKEIEGYVKEIHPSVKVEEMRKDLSGFIQCNYTDRKEKCFVHSDKEVFHDQIGFFVYVKNDVVYAGCHSSNCVNDENKKIIKALGFIKQKIDFTFDKVSTDNKFNHISFSFIEKCIFDGCLGISKIFEKMYKEPQRIIFTPEGDKKSGSLYYWDGSLWKEDDYSFVERLMTENLVRVLRDYLAALNKEENNDPFIEIITKEASSIIKKLNNGVILSNILRFSQNVISNRIFQIQKDIHPYLLSCKNGLVDLRTGEIRPSKPEDYITKSLSTEYDKDCDYTLFDNFVRQITSSENGPSEEKYNYLKWAIGYSLQGQPKRKLFFILYGQYGNNGKSLLTSIILDTIEHYGSTMNESVVFETGRKTAGSHSTELCQLENCRIGVLADTKENSTIDDGQMKQYTSITDKISTRQIYGKQKEFKPVFVPFINTNHPIQFNTKDKAMYERFIVIDFVLSFVQEPKDENFFEKPADNSLPEKLKNSKKEVLKWLIDASIYYNNNQSMDTPDSIKKSKEDFNRKVDAYSDFLARTIVMCKDKDCNHEEHSILSSKFLQIFKEYCNENNIKKIQKKKAEDEFDKMFKVSKKGRKKYYGLSLKEDLETQQENKIRQENDVLKTN